MPHLIIEYTDNIKEEANIPNLLKKANNTLLMHKDIIPIGGLRTRAIGLTDYYIADGTEDDAFIHLTLKIGKGRCEEEIKNVGDDLFAVIREYFKDLFEKRYLAISMEIYEFSRPTYKQNNIHLRYQN
ncbi:5-carboxymethyl-2-hydroxymuconate Delta-isomerase [Pseudogracilibacillus sp. SE30717A]|uniref:5-carboxymethyl-2-hydroxymuconate Delta-isomerase n=1 Tax=Pseudogracilibacillus sp. SE30717A TaxID=3098293 RepID=UPI00300E4005